MNPEPEQAAAKAESKAPRRRAGAPCVAHRQTGCRAGRCRGRRQGPPLKHIAQASEIGEHLAARTEGELRVVTHLFESRLPGYGGWQWYAVLTRNSRSKVITVKNSACSPRGLNPRARGVPWAERVRPEDVREEDAPEDGAPAARPRGNGSRR